MNRANSSLFLAAGLLALATAALCAERTETRKAQGFSGVALSVPAKVQLVQGDVEELTLAGDEKDLANIETVVEKGTLHLRAREKHFTWGPKIRVTLRARTIEALAISGSGDIEASALRSPSLAVAVSGAGDVRIAALETAKTDVVISGSGDVKLAGRSEALAAQIAGSGDLKAEKLEAKRAALSIAGSGDVTVWTREALTVSIAGSGSVRYYGEPTVDQAIRGSGSVKRLGASPT